MLCKIKFFLICISLCVISSNSKASSHKADSLFNSDNYFEAAIEYEYQLYQSIDAELYNWYHYRKALCYKQQKQFKKANQELQVIYFRNTNDPLFAKVAYQHALCLYLTNDYQKALWKIDDFTFATKDSSVFAHFLPLKALIYNELFEWDKAYNELSRYALYVEGDNRQLFLDNIALLYGKKHRPKIVNVKKAQDLSRFFPGAGQFYAGKPGEGTLNFLIQLSCMAFGAHQLSNGFTSFQFWNAFPFTGYLGGIGLLSKVYVGGIVRAGVLAEQANHDRLNAFNHEVNQLLLQTFE